VGKMPLNEKEKEVIKKACLDAEEIYKYIDDNNLGGSWKHDTERFMFFSYFEAKALEKNTKALTCWTIIIAIFTIVLGASTIWSIVEKYLS
jgi:hypothetical protein